MEVGLGLDAALQLTLEEQEILSREAALLGYSSIWTPDGVGNDAFQLCALRWKASTEVIEGGLGTGISVSPVAFRSPVSFASSAKILTNLTKGKFSLGIGTGGIYQPSVRKNLGFNTKSALAVMRDYLITIRKLLDGETVNYEGEAITLKQVSMGAPSDYKTPVLLGALGPKMLNLAGELADGAAMNWCDTERISWSREQVNEGAMSVGRDPNELKLVQYIRVCVDDDPTLARDGLARATIPYALRDKVPTARERQFAYRAHFERMGFAEELLFLDSIRNRNGSSEEVLKAFPDELLEAVGVSSNITNARDKFYNLADGLDTAIVRVVAAKPGLDSIRAVMQACAPNN